MGLLAPPTTATATAAPSAVAAGPTVVFRTVQPDPFLGRQWALEQIGAPAAWAASTGVGIRIGVVDTGVDSTHEDLAGKVVAEATCIGSEGDPSRCGGRATDDHGHGTHVSALAAAVTGNGKGVAGVAPGAELVVARALASDGSGGAEGEAADVAAAIDWVVSRGATVVNLSLGSEVAGPASGAAGLVELSGAIRRAWDRGVAVVVAVGNESGGPSPQPGPVDYRALPVLVVGATDRAGRVAEYSNSLALTRWALVAPGGSGKGSVGPGRAADIDVLSAWWVPQDSDSYAVAAGTSMSAPHVSGSLAVLMSTGLSALDSIDRLLGSADRTTPCGPGCAGRLDLARALGLTDIVAESTQDGAAAAADEGTLAPNSADGASSGLPEPIETGAPIVAGPSRDPAPSPAPASPSPIPSPDPGSPGPPAAGGRPPTSPTASGGSPDGRFLVTPLVDPPIVRRSSTPSAPGSGGSSSPGGGAAAGAAVDLGSVLGGLGSGGGRGDEDDGDPGRYNQASGGGEPGSGAGTQAAENGTADRTTADRQDASTAGADPVTDGSVDQLVLAAQGSGPGFPAGWLGLGMLGVLALIGGHHVHRCSRRPVPVGWFTPPGV
ncbi:MAG: S8 family serine peptidase [Acidimicrobiales bacterium]